MSNISYEGAQRLATLLSGSIKGVNFYPAGHPAILNPLQEILVTVKNVLKVQPEMKLGIVDGVFFVEDQMFFTPTTSIEELAARLEEKEISGIIFSEGIEINGFSHFVSVLGKNNFKVPQINRELAAQKIRGLTVKAVSEEKDDEDDLQEALCLKTYNEALSVISQIFLEIEDGRIPASEKIITVVRDMASLAVNDAATLLALSMIKDYDNYTFNHSVNVGVISMAIASHLSFDRDDIEAVGMAGFLHDVGKIRIEKSILNKPGKLTAMEFEEMKKHTESGTEIITQMKGISPVVAQAVLGHHIGYNRQGYPEWAREMTFTSMSEVVAVADCYDAITTVRVYRKPCNPKDAMAELEGIAGSYLNGEIVGKFKEMMGLYPVGTLVRLDNNEIAVVCRPNLKHNNAPTVKIVLDSGGGKLAQPLRRKLMEEDGSCYASIVAVVDPLLKGIDVASYLSAS